ncbi:Hint domain-containing protein [Shimia biformata]|uniref:Hint domain-containing protein n=1 Tax=Shimia biformata TaxID=1294299 RepID=UPI00194EF134|nr:Hint domain-containing protein [Shimia biformata]
MSLALQSVPGGGVSLVIEKTGKVFHAAVNLLADGRADIIRITYSWDLKSGLGRLAVEKPDKARTVQSVVENPAALSRADLRELALKGAQVIVGQEVQLFAASTHIEPIGPMPALTTTVPILTPNGYVSAGKIRRGDVVTTLEGGNMPVLDVVKRTVPARGLFEPVRLRAPYFELKRDIVVAGNQRLVIGGSRVEYLFGAEHVLVQARHLVNGSAAVREREHWLVTYVHILLPDHEAVVAAGTFVESLNIGRMRRKPDLHSASLLARHPRRDLPEHSRTICPVLAPFEAIILAEQRAA